MLRRPMKVRNLTPLMTAAAIVAVPALVRSEETPNAVSPAVAVPAAAQPEKKMPEGVCASIRIPFNASDMEECFQNLQKNFYGKQPVLTE